MHFRPASSTYESFSHATGHRCRAVSAQVDWCRTVVLHCQRCARLLPFCFGCVIANSCNLTVEVDRGKIKFQTESICFHLHRFWLTHFARGEFIRMTSIQRCTKERNEHKAFEKSLFPHYYWGCICFFTYLTRLSPLFFRKNKLKLNGFSA